MHPMNSIPSCHPRPRPPTRYTALSPFSCDSTKPDPTRTPQRKDPTTEWDGMRSTPIPSQPPPGMQIPHQPNTEIPNPKPPTSQHFNSIHPSSCTHNPAPNPAPLPPIASPPHGPISPAENHSAAPSAALSVGAHVARNPLQNLRNERKECRNSCLKIGLKKRRNKVRQCERQSERAMLLIPTSVAAAQEGDEIMHPAGSRWRPLALQSSDEVSICRAWCDSRCDVGIPGVHRRLRGLAADSRWHDIFFLCQSRP